MARGRASECLWTFMAVVAVTLATQAEAQDRAGVVTTLEGHVTVTRASLPRPAPLKFKDDIFVLDQVATSKDSVARILLGGRAVVTVREHSTVTITEAPGVATVDVAAGRVAVAVAREKMRAGDRIEVRTPNAVAGIRGTVIVAEVLGVDHSVVTVLKGSIAVTRLEAGRLVGTATIVNALQRVTVAGPAAVSAERIAPDAARQLGQEFRLAPPRVTPSAATAAINAGEVARAAKDLAKLPRAVGVDRRIVGNAVDDDQDEVTHEARGLPNREKLERAETLERARKPEHGAKTRYVSPIPDTPPAVKSYGGAADAINAAGEATKNGDRSGRRNRDRDRY